MPLLTGSFLLAAILDPFCFSNRPQNNKTAFSVCSPAICHVFLKKRQSRLFFGIFFKFLCLSTSFHFQTLTAYFCFSSYCWIEYELSLRKCCKIWSDGTISLEKEQKWKSLLCLLDTTVYASCSASMFWDYLAVVIVHSPWGFCCLSFLWNDSLRQTAL